MPKILNLHIFYFDLDEGYIIFNTTKAKKVVRVGLERKAQRDLGEYISYWRSGEGIRPDDYLFCNSYGENFPGADFRKPLQAIIGVVVLIRLLSICFDIRLQRIGLPVGET